MPKTIQGVPKPPDRKPAYQDTDKLSFGRYEGTFLQEVPASYFHYLWEHRPLRDMRLENYIHNNLEPLKKEYPDGTWE
jgi:hypothetical protein